ncbi:hypothetical protein KHP62_06765 [Rhodobacteraceae bacterium NNCM2]|nr:hypothetical protein [Coraliihabitans acroporae]
MSMLTPLDQLDLGQSIASHEGVDVNYASRIRSQYLIAQSTVLVTQTQFADAKAAALMTLSGLLMFRGPAGFSKTFVADPMVILSLAFNFACLVACILAIIPRIRADARQAALYGVERFSWLSLSTPSANLVPYCDFMRRSEVSQLIISQARANQASAHVLRKKFQILRVAFILGLLTIATIATQWLFEALQP